MVECWSRAAWTFFIQSFKLKIENYRYLKSLRLPSGWEERKSGSGMPQAVTRVFSPTDHKEVRFKLFYRGLPLSTGSSESFRKALKLVPQVLFEHNGKDKLTEYHKQIICSLRDSLGNVGNNQIANTETGLNAAPFSLERLAVLMCEGKPVLKACGWFINPKTREHYNAFCGMFFDTSQNEHTCTVEEIFLESETDDLYTKVLPQFEKYLQSIEWQTEQLA
jgi:hypothetical protein